MITIDEAAAILAARGTPMDVIGLRKNTHKGQIPGARKIGGVRGIRLVPREWAETYKKNTRGRLRADAAK